MSPYSSNTLRRLLSIAAMSGACTDAELPREQAAEAADAGSTQGLFGERYLMEREMAYCGRRLDIACRTENPGTSYCDLAAYAKTTCASHHEATVVKNSCDGVTVALKRPFGGHMYWHYDDNGELIGASLAADTTQYCGEREIQLGDVCDFGLVEVPLCVKDAD